MCLQLKKETDRANCYETIAHMVDSAKERCQDLQAELEARDDRIESLSTDLEKASSRIACYVLRVQSLEEGMQRKSQELEEVIMDAEAKQKVLVGCDKQFDELNVAYEEAVRLRDVEEKKLQAYKVKLAESNRKIEELTCCIGTFCTCLYFYILYQQLLFQFSRLTTVNKFVFLSRKTRKQNKKPGEAAS